MLFDVGGVHYTAAPFNGWYMGTEIGARNLSDDDRYAMLPEIARRLGLNTSSSRTLWRDLALVELNIAVLHSYERAGVKMLDHHLAAQYFMQFNEQEMLCGREVTAEWSWIVPPISGSATPVFHLDHWRNVIKKPNYFAQSDPWSSGALEVGRGTVG
jgi:nitric-oxide synthase